jgi:hypothetical protein
MIGRSWRVRRKVRSGSWRQEEEGGWGGGSGGE